MSVLTKDTERASAEELNSVDLLAEIFQKCPLTLQEKLVNPGLFMRRVEMSYLLANYEIFKQIQSIKGSIFYFGVYHGAGFMTFANLAAALEPFNHTRELIGFDTFTGYPEISKADCTHGKEFRTLVKGGFSSQNRVILEMILRVYDQNRPLSHIRKTSLIAGDVCKTLPEFLASNQHCVASLIVLTMNLYEPTKTALSLMWPRMPKGALAVIHSLNEDYYPGAVRAVWDAIGTDVRIQTFSFAPNLAYIVKD